MNILLINPPAMRNPDFPPLGLLSIGTVLRQQGYEIKILDLAFQSLDNDSLIKITREFKPDLIGITTYILDEKECFNLVKEFKRQINCLIVLGGPHSSCFPKDILEKQISVDFIVIKEGEVTIVELCHALEQSSDLSKINGIAYRDANNKVLVNPPRVPISNLNDFPMPDRSLIDLNLYQPIPSMFKRLPSTSIITARGCPYSCTYCFQAGKLAQKYQRRSCLNVLEEIEYLIRDFGIREITFWDDEFVLNNKWVYSFCDLLRSRDIDITWSCFGRIGNITSDLLHKMADAGCWSISYGIESGNQESLDSIKKGVTIEEIRNVVKWTHEAGIETRCSFMLALPGETPEMGRKTIEFAVDLDIDYAQFFTTHPLPGTPLYEDSQKLGTLISDVENYGFSRPFRAPFVPYTYKNEQQVLDLLRKAHRRFYFRPHYFLKCLKKIKKFEDIRKYWTGIKMVMEV